jgi:hypothetical protein
MKVGTRKSLSTKSQEAGELSAFAGTTNQPE